MGQVIGSPMIYGQQTVGPSCEFFLLMSVLRMFSVFVLTRSSVQFTQFVLLSIHLFGGLLFLASTVLYQTVLMSRSSGVRL